MTGQLTSWVMTAPGRPFERVVRPLEAPGDGEATVEVAGCGVCHTDLSFLHLGVRTRKAPPLVLGHEVSGTVRAIGRGVDQGLVGKPVIVPAVLPCGECELCREGHRSICRDQIMPGNDRDGGFASHLVVPARYLCPVPDTVLRQHTLWELSVVSDAVATPFQAVSRAGVGPGDFAVVIGVGGIGLHCVQIAAAAGATVIAIDIDPARLEGARRAGARGTINAKGVAVKELRQQARAAALSLGAPAHRWKIFETSGTKPGQESAYGMLGYGASLAVVGYTMDKIEICLSNLMAFDATARGNWGADPVVYPELLEWIGAGRIAVTPYVERFPLDQINDVFERAHHGRLERRAVLVPGS